MTSLADARRARARRKTVKAAQDHFRKEMPGSFKGKKWALEKIESTRAPMNEARRLIVWFQAQSVEVEDAAFNRGDALALITQTWREIKRKYGLIDPCQTMALDRLEDEYAGPADEEIDPEPLREALGQTLALRPAIPKKVALGRGALLRPHSNAPSRGANERT